MVGTPDLPLDRFLAVQGDRLVESLTTDPEVIEAEDVVGVVVSEQGGLYRVDPFVQPGVEAGKIAAMKILSDGSPPG